MVADPDVPALVMGVTFLIGDRFAVKAKSSFEFVLSIWLPGNVIGIAKRFCKNCQKRGLILHEQ